MNKYDAIRGAIRLSSQWIQRAATAELDAMIQDIQSAAVFKSDVQGLLYSGIRLSAPRLIGALPQLEPQPLSLHFDSGFYYVYFPDGPGEVEYADFSEAYTAFLDARGGR